MWARYIFRIDDITPEMDRDNFYKIEKIFDKYNIQPIIWVVPDNQDPKLKWHGKIVDFRKKIKELSNKWWIVAQHGYQHVYSTKNSGIIGLNKYSEFAWLPYNQQIDKIRKGKKILEEKLWIHIKRWMAPAHSFDKNTCKVLKHIWFEYITDGIALYPFTKYGLKWLSQQLWRPIKLPWGIWTICLHPNIMKQDQIDYIGDFLRKKDEWLERLSTISYKTSPLGKLANIIFKAWFFLVLKTKNAYTKMSK